MLLIGFSWIIIACLAGMIITKVVPGTWEQRGPTVIMLTSVAAAFTSMLGVLIVEGINSFGPPTGSPWLGLGLSFLGALVAFVAYVGDVRRQPQHA
jgi:hypothetical protein